MSEGISEFWRKNTSNIEAIELANLLRALRKVAGHQGSNVGVIEYTGMSQGGDAKIVIEPALVTGRYPVSPEKVDMLVGLVTHEALHQVEWSDHVWKILEPAFSEMGGLARVGFQKMINIGEDIYIDAIADQKIFGLYVAVTRNEVMAAAEAKLRADVLSVDKLMHLWWAKARGNDPGPLEDSSYRPPLRNLDNLTRELEEIGQGPKSITARCQQRADLYLSTWQNLESDISDWKVIDKTLHWYRSSPAPREIPPQVKAGDGPKKSDLAPGLLQDIETQLAENSVDITPIIRSVVNSDEQQIAPTSRWDFNIRAHPLIDRRLVSRLRAIFTNYAGRNKTISRGLASGRIDNRRLYRAATSGRCFRQVDHLPDLDWSVTLLMDASGSMKGNKWRMVENTVANLLKALMGYRNRLQAYAYFESDGICMISQLIKDNQLFSVPPNGQTASGQALIAATYLMPKERKRNILIHVTDGQSNFGCDVQYGIDYCRSQNIHLITIGCGNKDRDAMLRQYGKTIQFLDHFGQLPQAIERLLKWTFLYGTRPRPGKILNPNPEP